MASNLQVAFALGVIAAEYVHGVRRKGTDLSTTNAIFQTLEDVASGELTLLNTPEERIGNLPRPPVEPAAVPGLAAMFNELAAKMPELTRQARMEHLEVAIELLREMR